MPLRSRGVENWSSGRVENGERGMMVGPPYVAAVFSSIPTINNQQSKVGSKKCHFLNF